MKRGATSTGAAAITAILAMFVLVVVGLGISSLISNEGISQWMLVDSVKTQWIADSGVEYGLRTVMNDRSGVIQTVDPTQSSFGAAVGLDAEIAEGTANNVHHGLEESVPGAWATLEENGEDVRVRVFRQGTNYLGARIGEIEIFARYRIVNAGTSADIRFDYTLDNFVTTGATVQTQNVNSTNWMESGFSVLADREWTWDDILNPGFSLRAQMVAQQNGGSVRLDHLYIRITYEIDSTLEPWAVLQTNIPLGDGQISSLQLSDEASRIHLNYATPALLSALFQQLGITQVRSDSIADSVARYRTGQFFLTVAEIQQIDAGITAAEYNAAENFLTVSSRVIPNAEDPDAPRAPINVNTASATVLHAVFRPIVSITQIERENLVNDIVAARGVTPFTCFRTTLPATTTDFYDFILTRGYLNATDKQWILQNADATDTSWEGGDRETLTTEFSYEGTVFRIDASASRGRVRRGITSIATDTGSYRPGNFLGQLSPRVHYQENF